MNNASTGLETFDILDGEVLLELDDFSKILWSWVNEETLTALPATNTHPVGLGTDNGIVAEYKYIFFIHYFNLLMTKVLGHNLGRYKSHSKKYLKDKNMRECLIKNKGIQEVLKKNEHNLKLLNAIIRNYISKLMQGGVSTHRLDSSLDMHYLNAISLIVPNIRKNNALRSHIIPLVIEDTSLWGRLKRIFSK